MSIRDFDPLLKRAAERSKNSGGKHASAKGSSPSAESLSGLPLSRTPVKIALGARNIKIADTGSAAELGRALNSAFGELAGDFRAFVQLLDGALVEDVAAALEPTLELAKHYCPVLTGDLKDSGYLVVEQFRDGARAEIGFARNGSPSYGIYVHEVPYQHADPTSDKFLEKAINEDYFNILQRITDRVKVRVG